MARINAPEGEGSEMARLWGLTPHLGQGLGAMTQAIYEQCSLPVREREAMRMRIAQLNQCHL